MVDMDDVLEVVTLLVKHQQDVSCLACSEESPFVEAMDLAEEIGMTDDQFTLLHSYIMTAAEIN